MNLRRAELVAALSLATDLAMGQPLEQALSGCVLAMRLGESAGFDDAALGEVHAQSLLRYVGCNADTHILATLLGDELAMRGEFVAVDPGRPTQVVPLIARFLRAANEGASPLQMALSVVRGLSTMARVTPDMFAGHCEVAQRLAQRLGYGPRVEEALGQLYERWDGRGLPHGKKGEAVHPAVRVVSLAQDVVVHLRLGGADAAAAVARERRGGAHDPRLVDLFLSRPAAFLADLEKPPDLEQVVALEPAPHVLFEGEGLMEAFRVLADFGDIKSPFTAGHSHGVAGLAREAALRLKLPAADVEMVEQAALVHDIGQVGVSAGIWTRAGTLTSVEWEKVRLHPYHTERILARPAALARIGALAALHHERLDGRGYPRGTASIPMTARLVAAADVFHALREPRPQRGPLDAAQAAEIVRKEARDGRLDSDAVAAVLEAAGQGRGSRPGVSGLTEREIEVLRWLARGATLKEIGARLHISPKTADNHAQRIYGKIGVSTRAGAALFAMEHGLCGAEE